MINVFANLNDIIYRLRNDDLGKEETIDALAKLSDAIANKTLKFIRDELININFSEENNNIRIAITEDKSCIIDLTYFGYKITSIKKNKIFPDKELIKLLK
jgi:hypothetical protein